MHRRPGVVCGLVATLSLSVPGCASLDSPVRAEHGGHAKSPANDRPDRLGESAGKEVPVSPPAAQNQGPTLGWPVWIGIVCDDLEAQRHFYGDVMGLKELQSGPSYVWFDLDGKLFELLAKSSLPQYNERRVVFAFDVADIHAARAQLVKNGVEPVTEIEGGPGVGQYWAYFKDAEGNLFEIVQRTTP